MSDEFAKYNRDLIVNTLILALGQVVPSLIGLIILPVLTNCLTTSEYGIYDLILTLITLLIPFATLQIQQAAFRFLISSKENFDKKLYFTNSFLVFLIFLFINCSVIYIILNFIVNDKMYVNAAVTLLGIQSLYRMIGQVSRGLGKNKIYSLGVTIYAIANFVFIYIFLVFYHYGIMGVLLSQIFAYGISAIIMGCCCKLSKYFNVHLVNKKTIVKMLRYSLPIVPESISLWVVNFSDRMLVTYILGAGEAGIYAVANKIPSIYTSAYGVFNLAWTESASRLYDNGKPEKYYSELFEKMFRFLTGCLLLLTAATYIVFKLFIGSEYFSAFYQVPILYVGVFLGSLSSFFGGIYIALGKTKNIGATSIAGAVLNIAVNLLLIKKIGLFAASVSTVISYLIILVYRCFKLRTYMTLRYNVKSIIIAAATAIGVIFVNFGNNVISCVFSLLLAVIYNFIENMWLLNYFIEKMKAKLCK